MSEVKVILKTPSGPLELRRPRSGGEKSAVAVSVYSGHIEEALIGALRANPAGVQRLTELGSLERRTPSGNLMSLASSLMQSLARGRLVIVKAGDGDGGDSVSDKAWRAYEAFQARFGREFSISVQRHRLVPRESAEAVRRESDYDVVPAIEAAAIVTRLLKSATSSELQSHSDALAASIVDMRGPAGQSGFVLMRAPLARALRAAKSAEVTTPAKLRRLAAKHWFEIEVRHEQRHDRYDDKQWVGRYEVILPDGEKRGGSLVPPLGGRTYERLDHLDPGTCRLSLGRATPADWGN